jgi:glycosyltransferase involved in cell wall biosynthesis
MTGKTKSKSAKVNISVVIPAYNAESTIMLCLNALRQQDIGEPFEIIVVDSSHDATPQLIRRHFPEVKLIHFDQRTDHGSARNIGIAQARGEIICLVDSDCVTPRDWLSRMVAAHKSPDIGVVGGPVMNGNPETAVSWAGYMLEFNDLLSRESPELVMHVGTCNVSYKREIFDRYKFLSATLYAHVDLYFHWCLHQAGIKILFDPHIFVHHHHRTTLKGFLLHQHKIGRGTVQVLKRTDLRGSYFVKRPWLATLLLPVFPVVKFFRTSYIMLRWRKSLAWQKPLIFPLFALGLMFWIVGFGREVLNFHDQPWRGSKLADEFPQP